MKIVNEEHRTTNPHSNCHRLPIYRKQQNHGNRDLLGKFIRSDRTDAGTNSPRYCCRPEWRAYHRSKYLGKGTTNGVTTDLYGKFSLNVKRGATLVISYIGYKTQEAKADANMKITLTEDSELLDEVVVVGYGVQKRNLSPAPLYK